MREYMEKLRARGDLLEVRRPVNPKHELAAVSVATQPPEYVEGKLSDLPLITYSEFDLMVPASTEIVIEGRFLPNERRDEGPFGEFMGYYTPVGKNAVFEVLGVTCRKDAVFHSIACGSSEEVLTIELSVAANIYQRINAILPGIVDVTCTPFVLHVVVKIRQQYEGHARQVLLAVFGADLTWAKNLHRGRRRREHLRHERRRMGRAHPLPP
jgi:UbiD family decarboxylase